jgi:hypothetical protein
MFMSQMPRALFAAGEINSYISGEQQKEGIVHGQCPLGFAFLMPVCSSMDLQSHPQIHSGSQSNL